MGVLDYNPSQKNRHRLTEARPRKGNNEKDLSGYD
jgi:hypothetical protein